MESERNTDSRIEQAGEDLFNYAIDREDLKALLAYLPDYADIERGRVEYELGILRILSVGWSISYFLSNSSHKDRLAALFWQAVQDFSQSVSSNAGLMIGQDIDYFQILKARLDAYVGAMCQKPDASVPAVVIGPEFARICGNQEDVYTVMTGTRMFLAAMGSVKDYLEAIKLRIP
jgi:hypothetical protein